ncbi:MAG TPA: chromate transporter [Bryobacteraceae bacterium]|nr:chromate transporter [Bryobacteraceae bacterium]
MNLLVLYLLLLKATVTSFSGLTSLPVVRNDLVLRYHVLTDRELNAAVAAGQAGPGPYGLYVVSVGYFVAGTPGAFCGWLAMVTPAFLVIPLVRYIGARAGQPRVRNAIRAVTLAAAGLVAAFTVPLARDALTSVTAVAIAAASFLLLVATRLDTLWIVAGAAAVGLVSGFLL